MFSNEKGRPEGRPIPNAVVYHDALESTASPEFAQALARSVFGRNYVVEHSPIMSPPRGRARSRIRAWRAAA